MIRDKKEVRFTHPADAMDALRRRMEAEDAYPSPFPDPSCSECRDSGWVFVDGSDAVRPCPRGCSVPAAGVPPTPDVTYRPEAF